MSFIQDNIMINNVSTAPLKLRVITLARRLNIHENQALFLLILYSWKAKQILADLASHSCLATMLIKVCSSGLRLLNNPDIFDSLLVEGRGLLVCPVVGCTKFLNPSALTAFPI